MPTDKLFKELFFDGSGNEISTEFYSEYFYKHLNETLTNISATNILAISKLYINKSSADCLSIAKALKSPTTDDLPTFAIYTQIKKSRIMNNISLIIYYTGYDIINDFFGQYNIGLEAVSDVEKLNK